MPKVVCLNMIVKNEKKNLERCLASVAPFIDSWVICDTGSTDLTQGFVMEFMKDRGIPGILAEFEFKNFAQARNRALSIAATESECDYILLMDADMEFCARNDAPFEGLISGAYRMEQIGGGLTYWNTRIIRTNSSAEYVGVTHEVLATRTDPVNLDTAFFIDHMDGGTRHEKFERDRRLLGAEMERNPEDPRTVYYFAQTMKDISHPQTAAKYYVKRSHMGGWDEEAWHARLQAARCFLAAGEPDVFVSNALAAYGMRPTRSEPLLDLARHYRTLGQNHIADLFVQQGLLIPYPKNDILFVEQDAYWDGFHYEQSIVAYHTRDLDSGLLSCDMLATRRSAPQWMRDSARSNLQFYAKPLGELAPSFKAQQITTFYGRVMNPSIVQTRSGRILTTLRNVNYTIRPDGSYVMDDGETAIRTRNFLAELDPKTLELIGLQETLPPHDYPAPAYDQVLGFEDMRLFTTEDDSLHFIATVRDFYPSGVATPVTGILQPGVIDHSVEVRIADWHTLARHASRDTHEKNWMPVDGVGQFVYSSDPTIVLGEKAHVAIRSQPHIACDNWRGGSQLIHFMDGWLAIIHEVDAMPGDGERSYQHRFVFYDRDFKVKRWSHRFYLQRRGIEFVAGLCWAVHDVAGLDNLVISWGGNRDSEAWVGTISADDVEALLLCQ